MQTFEKRSIDVLFSIVSGSPDGQPRQISFSGLRVSARIRYEAGAYNMADIQIYGLSQDFMRQLITIHAYGWTGNSFVNNRIALRYTDETNVTIFEGGIVSALIDYNTAPEVPFAILASATHMEQMTAPEALSFPGSVTVETILQKILGKSAGKTLENKGVDTVLTDESVNGSVMDMIDQVCRHANIEYWMQNNTLIIAPKGATDKSTTPIELTPETGLVGWPVLTQYGCNALALFSPDYVAMRTVKLACPALFDGTRLFFINGMTHEIDSEVPGGRWHTRLRLQLNTSNG